MNENENNLKMMKKIIGDKNVSTNKVMIEKLHYQE